MLPRIGRVGCHSRPIYSHGLVIGERHAWYSTVHSPWHDKQVSALLVSSSHLTISTTAEKTLLKDILDVHGLHIITLKTPVNFDSIIATYIIALPSSFPSLVLYLALKILKSLITLFLFYDGLDQLRLNS